MMTRLLFLAVFLPGCGLFVEANPSYCERSTDCEDPARPFCDVAGEYGDQIANRCIASPVDAGPSCDDSADCTLTTAPICSETTSECEPCVDGAVGDQACTDKDETHPICLDGACVAGCAGSDECPQNEPICAADFHCAPCDDATTGDDDCYARDPALGRCTDVGICVACLGDQDCEGVTPICDIGPGTCRGCESHGECTSEVCDFDSGGCASSSGIIYVDGDEGVDNGSCGGQASPCRSIAGAQGGLTKIDVAHPILRVQAGLYNESISVTSAKTVVIVGPDVIVSPPGSTNTPALRVGSGGRVTVRELTLSNATGGTDADGVQCTGGTSSVELWKVAVSGNQATGVQVADCDLTISRSQIVSNVGGGISISDADFTIVNSLVVSNGNVSSSQFGGVLISNSGTITTQVFDFNTVARNQASIGSSGVTCNTGTAMIARNSIVYGGFGTVPTISGSCGWAYSDVEEIDETNGNIDRPPLFKDEVGGNFHLQSTSPCRNLADEAATVLVDYDGEVRPESGRSDMGADEYYPE